MISNSKSSKVQESLESTLSIAKESDVPLWSILENLSTVLYSQSNYIDAGVVAQASITCKANAIVSEKARQLLAQRHEISY
ncbi:MAG TPA: hypothetical protein V6C95_23515 [Coleofasciculaceae cyanobacterium]